MKWRVVMLRKLAIFIISAGLTMTPLAVQALGFGGIKLKSSLNEKLNAEVGLLSASADDVQSLKISLASEEAFLRSGIDRTALLNKLKFEVKQRTNGDYYIHVTTNEVVREPFMNFLLELNWKNGRMLREYTMLIDPPGRATKQMSAAAPVIAETVAPDSVKEPVATSVEEPAPFVESNQSTIEPVLEQPDAVAAGGSMETASEAELPAESDVIQEPAAALETFEPLPVVEPETPVNADDTQATITPDETETPVVDTTSETVTPEAVTDAQPFVDETVWPRIPLAAYGTDAESENTEEAVPQKDAPDTVASGGEMGDLDYGITQKNDNLWNIAEKLRQGDETVTVYQVMMALLQSNPEAFTDNNVHRLKVGHVLRISDPSVLTSMSRKEAANAFIAQTESWNNYRQQAANTTSVQPILAGESLVNQETSVAEKSGELTLASPDGESLTAGGGANKEALTNDLATMQDQLRQAKADAGTMRTRNVALNEKLQSLEDELNRLQRSLSVKDDELAALQTQLAALNQKPVETTQAESVAVPAPVEDESVAAVKDEMAKVETEKAVEAAPATPTEEQPVAAATVEEKQTETKAPATTALIENAPDVLVPEESILDTVMGVLASIGATAAGIFAGLELGSDSLLFIAAPIVLVLLIIVIIVVRRRRQGDNFQESILTGAASAAIDAHGANSGDSTTFSEESSFLSDFAMSGASAIQADDSEVDPLTEADVFMAYGRYEAAEERLNEAVNNEPNRLELRAKLLELHHATKNKAAFEAAAEDFYARLNGNESGNPLWDKVVAMGAEIAPGNPLFSQSGGSNTSSMNSSMFDDPGMGMTDSQVMDIGLETGVFEAADLSGSASDADMDFNLDLGESFASTSNAAPADDFDFNLDMGTSGSKDEPESPEMDFNLDFGSSNASDAEEPSGLDFNLDIGSEPAAEESASLDFNLDFGSDSTESADAGLDFNIGGMEDDISLDMDSGSGSGMMDLNLDASDTADADIGGGDEVGTKLDLAKAYIDMGDPEGARSILDEVLDEGSATQKEEAQSLLGQIA